MGIIGVPAAGRGGRKEVEPMEQQKIDRINQLARKSKSPEGLAPEERAEQAALRQEDIAARVGGDEFLIFLAYNDSMEVVIDRIFRTLQGEYEGLTLSFSMGIASSTPEDRIYEVLLHQADQALYSVKRNGRGHYQFYDSSMEGMLSVLSPIESSKREGGKKEEYV